MFEVAAAQEVSGLRSPLSSPVTAEFCPTSSFSPDQEPRPADLGESSAYLSSPARDGVGVSPSDEADAKPPSSPGGVQESIESYEERKRFWENISGSMGSTEKPPSFTGSLESPSAPQISQQQPHESDTETSCTDQNTVVEQDTVDVQDTDAALPDLSFENSGFLGIDHIDDHLVDAECSDEVLARSRSPFEVVRGDLTEANTSYGEDAQSDDDQFLQSSTADQTDAQLSSSAMQADDGKAQLAARAPHSPPTTPCHEGPHSIPPVVTDIRRVSECLEREALRQAFPQSEEDASEPKPRSVKFGAVQHPEEKTQHTVWEIAMSASVDQDDSEEAGELALEPVQDIPTTDEEGMTEEKAREIAQEIVEGIKDQVARMPQSCFEEPRVSQEEQELINSVTAQKLANEQRRLARFHAGSIEITDEDLQSGELSPPEHHVAILREMSAKRWQESSLAEVSEDQAHCDPAAVEQAVDKSPRGGQITQMDSSTDGEMIASDFGSSSSKEHSERLEQKVAAFKQEVRESRESKKSEVEMSSSGSTYMILEEEEKPVVVGKPELEGSSSGDSRYQSFEAGSDGSKTVSRPNSSDVEVLLTTRTGTSSEYDTAATGPVTPTAQDLSSKSGSAEYYTAQCSVSSRESMHSVDSESSGNLASVEVSSETSETLVPSTHDWEEQDVGEMDVSGTPMGEDIMSWSGGGAQWGSVQGMHRDCEVPSLVFTAAEPVTGSSTPDYGEQEEEQQQAQEAEGEDEDCQVASGMKRSMEMTFHPEPQALVNISQDTVDETESTEPEKKEVEEDKQSFLDNEFQESIDQRGACTSQSEHGEDPGLIKVLLESEQTVETEESNTESREQEVESVSPDSYGVVHEHAVVTGQGVELDEITHPRMYLKSSASLPETSDGGSKPGSIPVSGLTKPTRSVTLQRDFSLPGPRPASESRAYVGQLSEDKSDLELLNLAQESTEQLLSLPDIVERPGTPEPPSSRSAMLGTRSSQAISLDYSPSSGKSSVEHESLGADPADENLMTESCGYAYEMSFERSEEFPYLAEMQCDDNSNLEDQWVRRAQFAGATAPFPAEFQPPEAVSYPPPLEDILEEDTESSQESVGKLAHSMHSSPDFDVLAGRKFFGQRGDAESSPVGSLGAENNHGGRPGSEPKDLFVNGKRVGHQLALRDDVSTGSGSSLREFEHLEKRLLEEDLPVEEQNQQQVAMRSEGGLSEIEEGHESQVSESESFETISERPVVKQEEAKLETQQEVCLVSGEVVLRPTSPESVDLTSSQIDTMATGHVDTDSLVSSLVCESRTLQSSTDTLFLDGQVLEKDGTVLQELLRGTTEYDSGVVTGPGEGGKEVSCESTLQPVSLEPGVDGSTLASAFSTESCDSVTPMQSPSPPSSHSDDCYCGDKDAAAAAAATNTSEKLTRAEGSSNLLPCEVAC